MNIPCHSLIISWLLSKIATLQALLLIHSAIANGITFCNHVLCIKLLQYIKIGPQCVRVATVFLFALVCEYDVVEYVQLF